MFQMKAFRQRPAAMRAIFVLLVALFAAATGAAQAVTPAQKGLEAVSLKLASNLAARDMPYRVIVPRDYNRKSTERFPVVYLLHGLTGHFDNWTDRTAVKQYAESHRFIIVTPEGANGWYSDSVADPKEKYESYIIKELIPEIDRSYRTVADRDHRFIAGLSMGGYGSIKFGLKYPEMFTLVGSFSGALGAAGFTEKNAAGIGKSIDVIFGPEGSETRAANDIFKAVKEISTERVKALPFIYLSCGTEDFLFQNNREFNTLLIEKKIPHEYREHPGAHSWPFWDAQVREFLAVAERHLVAKNKGTK
jgi:putative tributyrin esterase